MESKALRILDLSCNALTGAFPASVFARRLPHLERLVLAQNIGLTGPLGEEFFHHCLKRLKHIDLSATQVSLGRPWLGGLGCLGCLVCLVCLVCLACLGCLVCLACFVCLAWVAWFAWFA